MYPTTQEKEKALKVVEELFKHDFLDAISYHERRSYFSNELFFTDGFWDWDSEHSDFLKDIGARTHCGATKVCIDVKGLDWVIKVGFLRTTNPTVKKDDVQDYCEREANNFKVVQKRHLEAFFAETYELGEVNGAKFYLQERVECDEDIIDSLLCTYVEENPVGFGVFKESYGSEEEYSEAVMDSARWMGEEDKVNAILGGGHYELINFIDEFEINDLHSGNWGITSDGRMVIFDYSGYYG